MALIDTIDVYIDLDWKFCDNGQIQNSDDIREMECKGWRFIFHDSDISLYRPWIFCRAHDSNNADACRFVELMKRFDRMCNSYNFNEYLDQFYKVMKDETIIDIPNFDIRNHFLQYLNDNGFIAKDGRLNDFNQHASYFRDSLFYGFFEKLILFDKITSYKIDLYSVNSKYDNYVTFYWKSGNLSDEITFELRRVFEEGIG